MYLWSQTDDIKDMSDYDCVCAHAHIVLPQSEATLRLHPPSPPPHLPPPAQIMNEQNHKLPVIFGQRRFRGPGENKQWRVEHGTPIMYQINYVAVG